MASPAHIAIICSRLDLPGGIERAIINTVNLFTEKGHSVSLVILDETAELFYPLHPRIHIIQQPLSFGITQEGNILTRKIKLLSDVLKLRRILKKMKPGLVIATEYPFATAAVLTGTRNRARLVSWEHHHYHELGKAAFWKRMERLTYPRLDAVVCLNEDEKKYYEQLNAKPVVIPNFITPSIVTGSHRGNRILTVARLTAVKGIELLLQAGKIVLQKHPGWTWKIIGDGEMKKEVMEFIKKENLIGRLIIQTPVDHNIQKEYEEASIYVMTSKHECFPMTLLEAMAAALPCIAFDCETGPRHIITDKEDGLLIEREDTQKLAEAISLLITDEEKRKKMGEKASKNIQRFSAERVIGQWSVVIGQ